MHGIPASGMASSRVQEVAKYGTLSAELKNKLCNAITERESAQIEDDQNSQDLGTEIIEELMSIADGQVSPGLHLVLLNDTCYLPSTRN